MQYRQIFTMAGLCGGPESDLEWLLDGQVGRRHLVLQTIGFRDDLWLDANGNPLTDAAKTTEKGPAPEFRHASNRNHNRRSKATLPRGP